MVGSAKTSSALTRGGSRHRHDAAHDADGYAPDLTDVEVEAIGLDPFLITYALHDRQNRCVVTTEVSKPRRTRHNRHIPDVCNTLGVQCINSFGLVRVLDFSTNWAARDK